MLTWNPQEAVPESIAAAVVGQSHAGRGDSAHNGLPELQTLRDSTRALLQPWHVGAASSMQGRRGSSALEAFGLAESYMAVA